MTLKLELSGKKNLSLENISIKIMCRQVYRVFSLMLWVGPAHGKQYHPQAGGPELYKKAG